MAERSILRHLQGGCSSPIGVYSEYDHGQGQDILRLRATVLHEDGTSNVVAEDMAAVHSDKDAEGLGVAVANMLMQKGAETLLIKH
jgi:hydroxymethylbilane synthase